MRFSSLFKAASKELIRTLHKAPNTNIEENHIENHKLHSPGKNNPKQHSLRRQLTVNSPFMVGLLIREVYRYLTNPTSGRKISKLTFLNGPLDKHRVTIIGREHVLLIQSYFHQYMTPSKIYDKITNKELKKHILRKICS